MVEKPKVLKTKIKSWSKEVFGRVGDGKRVALNKLAF